MFYSKAQKNHTRNVLVTELTVNIQLKAGKSHINLFDYGQ